MNKAEKAIEKSNKNWRDLDLGAHEKKLLFGFKALLHSVLCNDGQEKRWLSRVNEMLEVFNVENLTVNMRSNLCSFGFKFLNGDFSFSQIMEKWLIPLSDERRKKQDLLSPSFAHSLDRLNFSLKKLEAFCEYIDKLSKSVSFSDYTKLLKGDSAEVESYVNRIEIAKRVGFYDGNKGEPGSIALGVAKVRLKTLLGGDVFQLELT